MRAQQPREDAYTTDDNPGSAVNVIILVLTLCQILAVLIKSHHPRLKTISWVPKKMCVIRKRLLWIVLDFKVQHWILKKKKTLSHAPILANHS
jgi:hypothetical protein